ncbi:MAG TPA: hypothetical protein VFA04_07705 [Bryobacteraceae bacterium]|nr:hypothetical protein [Bryobacteraceae bacterium]
MPNLNANYLQNLPASAFARVVGNNTFNTSQYILGYLGVGTTSPAFPIHNVGADATGKGVQTRTSNISTAGNSFAAFSATANNGAVINQLVSDGLGTGPAGAPSGYVGTYTNHPLALVSNNTERMRLTNDGKLLILTKTPYADDPSSLLSRGSSSVQIIASPPQAADTLLVISNSKFTNAIEGYALQSGAYGVAGIDDQPNSTGVYGEAYVEQLNGSNNYECGSCAATFEGNSDVQGDLYVNGEVSNNFSTLVIDHPLKPASHYLAHSYVASSEMINVYEGNVVTDAGGRAVVSLPEYVQAMNRDFRYQLTVVGQFAQAIVEQEVANNSFTIRTDKPGVKVSWHVTGVRQDAWAQTHPLTVEAEKPALEQGHYLHPELFGATEEKSVHWAHHPELMMQVRARRAAALARQKAETAK